MLVLNQPGGAFSESEVLFSENGGSSPASSRRILLRCCTMISRGTIKAKTPWLQVNSEKGLGFNRINSKIPNPAAASIELSETIRQQASELKNNPAATSNPQGLKIESTPSDVATPFPPRKPSQHGNI